MDLPAMNITRISYRKKIKNFCFLTFITNKTPNKNNNVKKNFMLWTLKFEHKLEMNAVRYTILYIFMRNLPVNIWK